MLVHLSLKHFAVVEAAELAFGPGLTVISGETGAGKSLLVDALSLLAGVRADSSVVRHGADRAELVGEFDLADSPAARAWLGERELDEDGGDTVLVRRVIRADGGSKAWINGRQITLAQLGEFAEQLVEIHGQHEHQALMTRPSQLALLDAYGRTQPQLQAVAAAAQHWSGLLREREALLERGDVSERVAWLTHQYEELDRDAPTAESLAKLLADHRRLAHASDLINACDRAFARLGEDDGGSVARAVRQIRADLQRVVEHEPRLGEVDAMLDNAAIQLDEALTLLDRVRSDLDLDPGSFDMLERQLGRVHELARKHRVSPEQLAARRDTMADELETLRGSVGRLEVLDTEIASARAAWTAAAATLTAVRRQAAAALSADTTTLIGELGMDGGRFEIALEMQDTERPDANGAERVEFLVAANPGQPARPLRKVASGGELSRISLAIEVAALGLDAVPTMVFDEVDTGISGAVAHIVGGKLRALGARRQVLCVTHLPQVAAHGHAHYRVSKAASEGVTLSSVEVLAGRPREDEIARMLGGAELTREARAAAKRLLSDATA